MPTFAEICHSGRAGRLALSWLVATAALTLYGYAALHAPALDRSANGQERRLGKAPETAEETAEERALAEAYWRRNPDVAADRYYGIEGQLGTAGALEHYRHHGQREGRSWGVLP